MGIISVFEPFDCFPSSLELNLKGKRSYSNWGSLMFSLFYYTAMVITVYFNVHKYLTDGSPSVVTTRTPYSSAEIVNVDKSAFQFSFLLVDSNVKPYSTKTTRPVVSTFVEILNDKIENFPRNVGEIKNCNKEQAEEKISQKAIFLADQTRCVEFNDDFNIGGSIFTGSSAYFLTGSLDVDVCSNNPILCQNPSFKEIEAIDDIVLVVGYETTDPNMNVRSGFTRNIYNKTIPVSPLYNYGITLTIQKTTVETDRNVIFNFFDAEESSFLSIVDLNVVQLAKQDFDRMSLNFEIRVSPQEITYSRSYQTIDDLIANIQAVTGLSALILAFILSYFQEGFITKIIAENCYFENKKEPRTNNLIRPENSDTQRIDSTRPMVVERTLLDSLKIAFNCSPNKKLDFAAEMVGKHTDYTEVIKLLLKPEIHFSEENSVNNASEIRIESANK